MNLITMEICVDSIKSALNAQKGGADRIELCSNLAVGGTSPSYALIRQCKDLVTIPTNVLIRPRGGDFTYSALEKAQILEDIIMCKNIGVNGIVIGALDDNGRLDKDFIWKCKSVAKDLQITFHRAIDVCINPLDCLNDLYEIGIQRVLTSGQASKALDGLDKLKLFVEESSNRISIMAGSGIRSHNIKQIIEATGVKEIHATAFGKATLNRSYMNRVPMGHESTSNTYQETSIAVVKDLIKEINSL